jgi:Transposase
MNHGTVDLNSALFVGIDSHPTEHTALAINRFEEEKGMLQFENTQKGIRECLAWLATLAGEKTCLIISIEGRETRHSLASYLLDHYPHVYEVNPLFTKQRRLLGTRTGKSDPADAKLIAEVLTRKLSLLPKFHEAIPKFRVGWFGKLTTNGTKPFVLSWSKDLTRLGSILGLVHRREFSPQWFCLRKTVKFYEEITVQGARWSDFPSNQ